MDAQQQPIKPIQFLSLTPIRLVILNTITFGVYTAYWFYKNFKAIKKADDSNIRPFWRTVFVVLFCYSLFKRVSQEAISHGAKEEYSAKYLAIVYIIINILLAVYANYAVANVYIIIAIFILSSLTVIPLIYVQRLINYNNYMVNPDFTMKRKFYLGEIIIIVFGVTLMLANVYSLFVI